MYFNFQAFKVGFAVLLLFNCFKSNAQQVDLIISITGATSVNSGQGMSYIITISNNGPDAANGATFNDNLPAGIKNASYVGCTASGGAVCPSSYSINNTNFSGTVPTLPNGGQIIMTINLEAPAPPKSSSFSNTATVTPPSGVTETNPASNSSIWNLTLKANIDIKPLTQYNQKTISCGNTDTLLFTIKWINNGTSRGDSILLNTTNSFTTPSSGTGSVSIRTYHKVIDTVWKTSPGTTLYSPPANGGTYTKTDSINITLASATTQSVLTTNRRVNRWEVGDTITLIYKVAIRPVKIVSGCGRTINLVFSASSTFSIPSGTTLTDTFSSNSPSSPSTRDTVQVCDPCTNIDITSITQYNQKTIDCGKIDTLTFTHKWVNNGPLRADSVLLNATNILTFSYSGSGIVTMRSYQKIIDTTWTTSSGTSLYPSGTKGGSYTKLDSMTASLPAGTGTTSGNDFLTSRRVRRWEVGDTITLTYKVAIMPAKLISGCGKTVYLIFNASSSFTIPSGINLIDTFSSNNTSTPATRDTVKVCNIPKCPYIDIKSTAKYNQKTLSCSQTDTLLFTFQWVNNGTSRGDSILLNTTNTFTTPSSGASTVNIRTYHKVIDTIWRTSSGTTLYPISASGGVYTKTDSINITLASNTTRNVLLTSRRVKKWEVGDTITLTYKVAIKPVKVISGCGRVVNLVFLANSSFTIPSGSALIDTFSTNDASNPTTRDSVKVCDPCNNIDIKSLTLYSQKTISCENIDTFYFTHKWVNNGPLRGDSILLTMANTFSTTNSGSGTLNLRSYQKVIDTVWRTSSGTTLYSPVANGGSYTKIADSLNFTLGTNLTNQNVLSASRRVKRWELGDTITLTYKIAIKPLKLISGCGKIVNLIYSSNSTFSIPTGSFLVDTFSSNNSSAPTTRDSIKVIFSDISISKSVSPSILNNGDTLTMNYEFQNSVSGITAILPSFIDVLPDNFSFIPSTFTCTASGGAACGSYTYNSSSRLLTYSVTNLPSGGVLKIKLRGIVHSQYDLSVSTSVRAINNCVDCVPITNVAETNFQINTSAYLGDFVWLDINKDGIQDVGEPGVSGVEVSLFEKNNIFLATTMTDGMGKYRFGELDSGTYFVKFSKPVNYAFTTQTNGTSNGSDVNVYSNITDSVVIHADNRTDVDAGLIPTTDNNGFIGDYIWYDEDGNGIQGISEKGFANVFVSLYDNAGKFLMGIYSDNTGYYKFSNLDAGTYTIGISTPAGFILTSSNSGSDDNIDNDLLTNTFKTAKITLSTGQKITNIDCGLKRQASTLGSIGNLVWDDLDYNDIQGSIELGVEDVKAILINALSGAKMDSMITDMNGNYTFNTVSAGKYFIQYGNLPSGYNFDNPYLGFNDGLDSDPIKTTGKTDTITLASGQINLKIDAGINNTSNSNLASVGNFVWLDEDKDGVQDTSETGISGVTAILYNSSNAEIKRTVSKSDGSYLFTNLTAGNYYIKFINIPNKYVFSPTGTGSASTDNNADATGQTANFTLSAGQKLYTIDAGIYPGAFDNMPASIGDRVWIDLNNNGLQNDGEPGIRGVKVRLMASNGMTILDSAITNGSGYYNFNELNEGKYFIKVVNSTLPSGYNLVTKNSGSNDLIDSDINTTTQLSDTISLGLGEDNMSIDAGIYKAGVASLGDYVWYDLDKDGLQDAAEPGTAGVSVFLYNSNDSLIATTQSDKKGKYLFTNLNVGTYYTKFINAPIGYIYTTTTNGTSSGSDADISGKTAKVTLSTGQTFLDLDAGLISNSVGAIGGRYWFDKNKDGIEDSSEAAIPGSVVYLLNSSQQIISSAITDANGQYFFNNLKVGTFYVQFVNSMTNTQFTKQTTGTSNGSDVDILTGFTNAIVLSAGNYIDHNDAGIISYNPATVGGNVWYDDDVNGIQDGIFSSTSGVAVQLYDASLQLIGTTSTNSEGNYQFTNLELGKYYIKFIKNTLPLGYSMVNPNIGSNDKLDSDADTTTGYTASISLVEGQYDLTWDLGIFKRNIWKIGGIIWADANLNGIQDGIEGRIANAIVYLYNAGGTPVTCNGGVAKNYTDNFASQSYNLNSGNINFTSDWTEANESNGPAANPIYINTAGASTLTITNIVSSRSISRNFSLLQANGAANITFNYTFTKTSSGTYSAGVEYLNGGSWTSLITSAASTSGSFSGSIPKTASSIRLNYTGNNTGSLMFIDNLNIAFTTKSDTLKVITDAHGRYEFSNTSICAISPNTTYQIRVSTSDPAFQGKNASPKNMYGNTSNNSVSDTFDSDGDISIISGFSTITVTTPNIGQNMLLDFGFGVNSPLPVKWLSFKASCNSNYHTVLTWETASEVNSSHFEIEKLIEDKWINIGSINGNGTSLIKHAYAFTDQSSTLIRAFYRIKQLDFNGVFEYSNSISNYCDQKYPNSAFVNVFPNPAIDEINIQSNIKIGNVKIFDAQGKQVYADIIDSNISIISTKNWVPGLYYIKMDDKTQKIVKAKN